MRTMLLIMLLGSRIATAHAEQFTGKVIVVLDGDTVMLARSSGPPVKVHLAGIDAPEKTQPGGMASKKSLAELVLRKQVSVDTRAVDNYGRLIAHLTMDGKSINEEQVRRGMAWEYSHYHGNKAYIELQSDAQQARRGLWVQTSPLPPWQWRKLQAADAPTTPKHATLRVRITENYTCGIKRHCSQMRTCDEAHFYLSICGVQSLDTNRDGVPCESVCGDRK